MDYTLPTSIELSDILGLAGLFVYVLAAQTQAEK